MTEIHSRGSATGTTDVSRMSIWTVVGAVAASVLTAAILGGASGIMQIPTMALDITAFKAQRDQRNMQVATLTERLRSVELTQENLQRQDDSIVVRLDSILARMDKKDTENRDQEISTQRDLAALEGRSKDRNTEAVGLINALRSEVSGLVDRQRQTFDALAAVRQNLYDLATRAYMRGNLQSPPAPEAPIPAVPYNPSPPLKQNGAPDYDLLGPVPLHQAAVCGWNPEDRQIIGSWN
jgi:TolA-binding protein